MYWAKCDAAHRELPEKLPKVWEYCLRHSAAGRFWHRCYALKLLELWEFLQAEKPRTILELGSGCTTAVFAEYANESGVRFETVDESAEFQSQVLSDVRHVFRCSFAAHILNKQFTGDLCGYGGSGDGDQFIRNLDISRNLALLYVDGPSNKTPEGKLAVCVDATTLGVMREPPTAILFDIRRESVAYTKQFYGERYRWDDSAWGQCNTPWYLSAIRHHTIARRRM